MGKLHSEKGIRPLLKNRSGMRDIIRACRRQDASIRKKTLRIGSIKAISRIPLGLVFATIATPAFATEGGGTTYPIGVNTAAPAVLPGPNQTELFNYIVIEPLTSLNGNNGKPGAAPFGGNLFAYAPRLVHGWGFKLGNIQFDTGISPVLQRKVVSVGGQTGYNLNMSAFDLQALYATWNRGNLHLMLGQDFWFPGSSHDNLNISNVSSTKITFQEEQAVTWTPGNWEFSVENTVQLSTLNRDTRYKDGALFSMDYMIGYRPIPHLRGLQFAVQGAWARQTSNDTQYGARYMDGYRQRSFWIGPQVAYVFSPGTAVLLKWQHALDARNTVGGDKYWIEFAVPLHFLE